MRTRLTRRLRRGLWALLLLAFPGTVLAQQTGAITGTVTGPEGDRVSGARVGVDGTSLGGLTSADGTFMVRGVPAGTYTLRVTHLGYGERAVEDVSVGAGETVTVDITLEMSAIDVGGVVVSASRRAERVTEAPATIARIGEPELQMSVGNSFSGGLKEVQGLDYIQIGATNAAINARGFNSSFNNRMLMLVDNRVSVLPESGLPVGVFTTVPKVDLASAEVIIGPGAALYGADATNGVLALRTKDPLQYPGTTIEVAGGAVDKENTTGTYSDIQFRHAGVADGTWGYKVSGERQWVQDFSNRLQYSGFDEIGADFTSHVIRGNGALTYYSGLNQVELSAGYSQTDGVGQTNVGRNQFIDWVYNFIQLEASTPHWYVNLYRNQSKSGDSFALNRYTENRNSPAYDGMTDEEVKKESDWPSNGRLWAAEVQNNFSIGELMDSDAGPLAGTEVVWGVQYRTDIVSSDEEWLTDRLTGEDVSNTTWGVYAQTRTPLIDETLDLLLAARYDDHDNYEAQFSPKAGLIYSPAANHAIRATYNRAFKSPTILQTNFWIPDFVPFVGVFGNTEGFTVRDDGGTEVATYDPLVPEENTTFELGYKGVINQKLFLDVAAYQAEYTNFFSPLTIIANPFASTHASFGSETEPILGETGNPQVVLTYFNLGEATIRGTDLAARYMVSENVSAKATFSWVSLESRDTTTAGAGEATALNAPNTKWTLGVNARDLGSFSGGATFRHVTGYQFHSGINEGKIPTFNTLDLTAAYELEGTGTQIMLNINNLFTCRAEDLTAGDDGACGFFERHREMINMPMVGAVVVLGIRYQG